MADYISDIITGVGGKVTPSTRAFMSGWQRKEGGATHNSATYNWYNRTDQGFPTINSVGVAAYPNYQTGIARTVQLINSGYPGIAAALRSGTVNSSDSNVQADLNRWLSGKRTPGMTPYVSSVFSLAGHNVGAGQSGATTTAAPTTATIAPQARQNNFAPNVLGLLSALSQRRAQRLQGQTPSLAPLLGQLLQFQQDSAPPPMQATPQTAQAAQTMSQGMLQLPAAGQWKGTHVTDGLGWGTRTAEDIMGSPGTGVLSPDAGVIEYFHPTGAQGGGSMMIRGDDGLEYWLGHIANGIAAGTRVTRGQRIADISGDHPRPHVHIDYRRFR